MSNILPGISNFQAHTYFPLKPPLSACICPAGGATFGRTTPLRSMKNRTPRPTPFAHPAAFRSARSGPTAVFVGSSLETGER